MIKNTVFMKHLKRLTVVGMALMVTITLSGCSSSDDVPYGNLDVNAKYASYGNTTLTVQELYDELRYNSLGYFNTRIEEAAFDEYMTKVEKLMNEADQDTIDLIKDYILKDIYGTSEEDEINAMIPSAIRIAEDTFIDNMYLKGYEITKAQLTAKNYESVYKAYYINAAKYYYAADQLDNDIKETNDKADGDLTKTYFTASEIANYYDENYKNDTDVEAVIIRFINNDEVSGVLRKFGLKTYKSEWYQIPEPTNNQGVTDITKWAKESDYNNYYDEYVIDPINNDDQSVKLNGNGNETVLKLFLEIYDYIYTYRDGISVTGNLAETANKTDKEFLDQYYLAQEIIKQDGESKNATGYETLVNTLKNNTAANKAISFDKERLDNYSSSLTSYVNNTLKTEAEEEGELFTQYTSSARSYNNNYYLIFKIDQVDVAEFYTEDEENDNEIVFSETAEAKELMTTILAELREDTLTDSYVTTKVNERLEELDIEIYDSVLNFNYSQSNTNYVGKVKSNKNLIGMVKIDGEKFEISVDDTYKFLEAIYGPSTSLSLVFNKAIEASTYYTDLEEKYDDYKNAVLTTLTNFGYDAYASYGYPSTMGKYQFMLAYFRSANIDEAIDYLMLQDAKREYFVDLNDDFYGAVGTYANNSFDNFYSLTISNITVYVDLDEDGEADKDFFNIDSNVQLAEKLIKDIIEYVEADTTSLNTSFSTVVAEYNTSSRLPSSDPLSVEAKWYEYRSKGLLISTNSMNTYTNTTEYETEIQTLVETLYNDEEVMYNNTFSGSILLTNGVSNNNSHISDDKAEMNLLLVTGGAGKTKVDFESEEDDKDLYTKTPIKVGDEYVMFDVTSDESGVATDTQIEVFCREYFISGAATSLPPSALTFLNTYLTPVLTKFNSEVSQMLIMKNSLTNLTFTDSTAEARLNNIIEIKQRQLDKYTTDSSFDGWWQDANLFSGKGGI